MKVSVIILEVTSCRKCGSVPSKNVKERRIPRHIVVAKSGYNIKPDIGRLYRGEGEGGRGVFFIMVMSGRVCESYIGRSRWGGC